MASSSVEKIIVPRNFVLLEELEKAEKGNTDMNVSYGLVDNADTSLSNWQCTILGPVGSPVEGRIISLILQCSKQYPDEVPTVKFQSKVNFPFVDEHGNGVPTKIPQLANWQRPPSSSGIEKVLTTLRSAMGSKENKGRGQPPDGATY